MLHYNDGREKTLNFSKPVVTLKDKQSKARILTQTVAQNTLQQLLLNYEVELTFI